jgi:GNAT superfamily N-acetyltransferase
MTEDLLFSFDPFPGEEIRRFIADNISNLNFARTGISEWHPLGFFLRSARGEYCAGLTGYIWGGWMHVDVLWVTERMRGQGHGARLLDAAEEFAIEHGAIGATLETHSFQAPGFYQRRGYQVFGSIEDYPPGHSKLFLRKPLTAVALA